MENEKGVYWLLQETIFPFGSYRHDNAESARMAAEGLNSAANQVVCQIYKITPGKPPAEIMI